MLRRITAVVIVTTALMTGACSAGHKSASPATPPSPSASSSAPTIVERASGEPADLSGLEAALAESGLRVGAYRLGSLRAWPSLFPGLRRYEVLPVADSALNILRFDTPRAAVKASARVDAYGGLPNVEFKGAPHFYRRGSTMVLYVEQDRRADFTVLAVLHGLLGDQIKGQW
jgi:hypothetical protein